MAIIAYSFNHNRKHNSYGQIGQEHDWFSIKLRMKKIIVEKGIIENETFII